jgi:hypothetical protein
MAKIFMLSGMEIWAKIESNTGTKLLQLFLWNLWEDLGDAKITHYIRLKQNFHKIFKTSFRSTQKIQLNSILKTSG